MTLTSDELNAVARAEDYNHNQYDAATNPYGMGGVGYKTPGAVNLQGNWSQSIRDAAVLANATAREATAAAGAAANTGATATSVTSNTIGTGAKSFTIQTGKAFVAGQQITAADATAATTNYMVGTVTSYDSITGALVMNATSVAGSGTLTSWSIFLNVLSDSDIGVTVQGYDADTLKADTPDELTVGYSSVVYNAGTQSSGTFTPDQDNGNKQRIVNGGAFTLAPPTDYTTIELHITNNGTAGTITTSGFTLVDGDSFTTTDTHEFVCFITTTTNGTLTRSILSVKALQ